MNYAVIIAGGSGTRFWPVSRRRRPKQMLALFASKTLLEETVDRIKSDVSLDHVLVVTGRPQADAVRIVLKDLPPQNLLVEPVGRDTAPAIGFAAMMLDARDPDAVMAVLSADHRIGPAEKFRSRLNLAFEIARDRGSVVTIGIRPTHPATGFGYLHIRQESREYPGKKVYPLLGFKEKPDEKTAKAFVESGAYFWNAGMFVMRPKVILDALREHAPESYAGLERIRAAIGRPEFEAVLAREFEAFRKISIDYAVMEKVRGAWVVEADFEWDDVGSWEALERLHQKDGDGNVALGSTELLDTKNCTVYSAPNHLVAAIGVSDLVIVHTPDVTYVCRKEDLEKTKDLVGRIVNKNLDSFL